MELHVSSSLEELTFRLVERLRATKKTLFEPSTIVVPNAMVRTFVQFEVARRLGIAANIDFQFLTPFLAELVPEKKREHARALEKDMLESLLLGILSDDAFVARDELGPVRDYLHAAGVEADVVDLRRVQLAARVAHVFDEYALTRPELLEAWEKGTTLPAQHTQASTEAWERALWLEAFGEGGHLAKLARRVGGGTWLPLPTLLGRLGTEELAIPSELHVFGFTHFAPAYQRLLVRLSERAAIRVYAFSPCDESATGLERFGRPSFEHLALWEERGVEPATRTVGPLAPERIKVLACPSVAREVEIVASEIWELLRESEAAGRKLRLSEIAVLVAGRDQDAYRSQIAAVLPRACEIPVSSAGIFRARESRALEAARLLLDLPSGTFKRSELLRLMTHPNVLAIVPDADAEQWFTWCEELGILGGADRADLAGTYVRRDLHNWDQGLKRLALGAFVSGERSRDASLIRVGGEDYVPLDHAPDETSQAGSFALLARSLIADALAARRGQHTLREWAAFFQHLIRGYLAAVEDDEDRLLGIVAHRLGRLEELDLDGRAVSYRVARELARAQLDSLGESRGHELAGGVVVAPLLAGRPIPFRAVFVLGLGESDFPASTRADLLDLRSDRRARGEASAQDRDRLAFLEVLATTRERLTLSYVARDATTGERLAPSSLVREVEAAFGASVEHETHKLRRYDERYFAPPLGAAERTAVSSPEALREAQVRALRKGRDSVPGQTTRSVLASLDDPARTALGTLLGACPPHDGQLRAAETVRISLHDLCEFLVSPLQGWASRRLRLAREDEEPDVLLREDEVFAPTKLVQTIHLREVMFDALSRGGDLGAAIEAALEARTRSGELGGELPTGVFLDVAVREHRSTLDKWRKLLASSLEGEDLGALVPHRFGASDDFGSSDVLHGPIVIHLDQPRKLRVEIMGRTNRILAGASGSVVLVASEAVSEKHRLRGFLDHAALAASGVECPKKTFRVLTVPATYKPQMAISSTFQPFTPAEARAWLTALVADYTSGEHAYLLAIEPVLEVLRGEKSFPLAQNIIWWRDSFKLRPSDAWGPISDWKRCEPPADAASVAKRRLGPYVERGGP
jgi:exodeoxyribonuclease V gamma subunit